MQKAYFISGIHTDAGKTVASAFLQLALDADYWKPIQAGDLDFGDTDRVKAWTGSPAERFHPVRHSLRTPASPHYAATLDGVQINLADFTLPSPTRNALASPAFSRGDALASPALNRGDALDGPALSQDDRAPLLVEGAGGLLVPINDRETVADLIKYLGLEVILVSRHYLGSINHTMLSIAYLRSQNIPLAGLIYSGGDSPETVRIIGEQTGVWPLIELPELKEINQTTLTELSETKSEEIRRKLGLSID
ncbi:ATP-dependent dethiobiotin synthetase BioD [Neolewinella antarctica]|uniref:ATP-dependent dethiobiotin synthetase BioD n=1 Tax=Neolewinella antarctica TaxID=442734 RepID=A0ABX0X9X8_9BACT|nr:dethiobiotin synthase [Neolewinella antarctica]NJC25754.1 dethiobiotin synthetase [Neolewinella antarctica]